MGGKQPGSSLTIDYINIQTEGDAVDFGDLTVARSRVNATGNGIGGLQ